MDALHLINSLELGLFLNKFFRFGWELFYKFNYLIKLEFSYNYYLLLNIDMKSR